MNKKIIYYCVFLTTITRLSFSQKTEHLQDIDGIAAIIDDKVVLLSDINQSLAMAVFQNRWDVNKDKQKIESLKNQITQSFVDRKIILSMAELDSIMVDDKEVDRALEQQMQNMITQAGGEKEAEVALGQPLRVFKREYWYDIKDMLVTQKYQQQLINKINITKPEVEDFFNEFRDSIPSFPNMVKARHILLKIEPSDEQKKKTVDFLNNLKQKIINNDISFEKAASDFTQDPGSKNTGGSLGFVKRGVLVRDFEAVAFNLKPGEISDPVLTQFGYHIIKTEEIRGDKIKVRHVLMTPPTTNKDETITYNKTLSYKDSTQTLNSFIGLAKKISMDETTKKTGGSLGWIDPNNYPIKEFGLVLNQININEVGGPIKTDLGYHLLWIESIKTGGKPKLETHWSEIEKIALNKKKEFWFKDWVSSARKNVYIDIKK